MLASWSRLLKRRREQVQEGTAPPPRCKPASQARYAGTTPRSSRGMGLSTRGVARTPTRCSVASREACWAASTKHPKLEFQGANDSSDWVVYALDPMRLLALNPEDLRFDTTQGSPRRGRGLLGHRRAEGGAACTVHPTLEFHEVNDSSDWVINVLDPMDRLTLNPEVLKLDTTQESSQRARTPSASSC